MTPVRHFGGLPKDDNQLLVGDGIFGVVENEYRVGITHEEDEGVAARDAARVSDVEFRASDEALNESFVSHHLAANRRFPDAGRATECHRPATTARDALDVVGRPFDCP